MKKDINEKIEQILHSLDGVQQAAPTPFFFTRLEARMKNKKSIWEKVSYLMARPAVAFAGVAFIIFLNALVIFTLPNDKNQNTKQGTELATVDEYSQVNTNFNEFENLNP